MSDNLSKSPNSIDEASKMSAPLTNGIKMVEEGGGLPLMQVRIENLSFHAYK